MRLHRVAPAALRVDRSVVQPGWILSRDVVDREGGGALRKGRQITEADIAWLATLRSLAPLGSIARDAARVPDELHFIEMDAGDLHEAEAGERLARAVAGPGAHVGALAGGAWPLRAAHRGLLRVAIEPLSAVNAVEGACVYSRRDGQVVDADAVIARAKITPLVLPADRVTDAERIARAAGGVVRVAPFRPVVLGLVVQETLAAHVAERAIDALRRKLIWFGSRLAPPLTTTADAATVAAALERVVDAGAQMIIVAGTRSLDPLDPTFAAMRSLGIELDRHGVPVHPGSLLWCGHWRTRPVIGVPTCGLFAQQSSFDVILPRFLAGECTDSTALAALAHGGLLERDASPPPWCD